MTLYHVLLLSAFLFSIGVYGTLTRRNIIGVLLSLELMFNAAAINFVAFNHYLHPERLWGQGFVVFIITLAAAEAVVGLSLVLAIYKNVKSLYTERMSILHG